MKYLKLVFYILIISSASAYAYEIKLSSNNSNAKCGFIDMDAKDNKIAILGSKFTGNSYRFIPTLEIYEDKKWSEISTGFNSIDTLKSVLISNRTKIKYDKNGDIWVTGKSLYKYSNGVWKEYFLDDSLKAYRNYFQFCIDIYGNIWVVASVYNSTPRISHSEILKFDGNKFNVILRTDCAMSFDNHTSIFGESIAALPDGRIIVTRSFCSGETSKVSTDDVYLFNQDGTWDTSIIWTSDSLRSTKRVFQIYPVSKDKIWFCFEKEVYADLIVSPGIGLWDLSSWTFLDEFNGLPKMTGNLYPSVYGMVRTIKDGYLVLAEEFLFKMSESYNLTNLDWKNTFDKSELIISKEFVTKNYDSVGYVNFYFRKLFEPGNNLLSAPDITKIMQTSDGTIWLYTYLGIIKVYPDFMFANGINEDVKTQVIFPNPCEDFLNITYESEVKKIEVFDFLGNFVFSFYDNCPSRIDISGLSAGVYSIRIYYANNKIENKQFIKL